MCRALDNLYAVDTLANYYAKAMSEGLLYVQTPDQAVQYLKH